MLTSRQDLIEPAALHRTNFGVFEAADEISAVGDANYEGKRDGTRSDIEGVTRTTPHAPDFLLFACVRVSDKAKLAQGSGSRYLNYLKFAEIAGQ